MIYTSARWADEAHTQVIGWDANGNSETVPADYTIFRLDNDGPVAFVRNGGTIQPYLAPDPVVTPPHLNGGGLIRFGTFPVTVAEAIKMIGAQRVAKGLYRGLHETIMPSDQYAVQTSILDTRPLVARVTARTDSFTEVRVTDLAGVAQDPTELTIETKRVVY